MKSRPYPGKPSFQKPNPRGRPTGRACGRIRRPHEGALPDLPVFPGFQDYGRPTPGILDSIYLCIAPRPEQGPPSPGKTPASIPAIYMWISEFSLESCLSLRYSSLKCKISLVRIQSSPRIRTGSPQRIFPPLSTRAKIPSRGIIQSPAI